MKQRKSVDAYEWKYFVIVVTATPVAMASVDSRTPPIFTPSYVNIPIMLRNDFLNIVRSTLSSRRRSGTVCSLEIDATLTRLESRVHTCLTEQPNWIKREFARMQNLGRIQLFRTRARY
ncbi:MAG TPA: hypothetical protein VGP85_12105 [Pyrinomonadaceae bacterium]|nr:hypothetical protein [Pyrinomonadaceae bacterium]